MRFSKKLLAATVIVTSSIIGISSCNKDTKEVISDNSSHINNNQSNHSLKGTPAFCASAKIRMSASSSFSNQRSVTQAETVYNTDFVSAGVGGLRNVGSGTIVLSGISGTVTKAILYWHGVTYATTDVGSSITVNASNITGTSLGVSSDNCWGFNNSQAYRADVTSLVQSTGNGSYELSGFGDLNPNGASLIVFFSDGNSTNNRDVVVFDGNDSNIEFPGFAGNDNAPYDPLGWDVTLSGINYSSGNVNLQMHVADGQSAPDASILINGNELVPEGQNFSGNTVPSANDGPNSNGNLWDIRTFDVSSFFSPEPTTLNMTSGLGGDCLALIATLIDLPAGAAPTTDIAVAFDIKPTSCPNSVNLSAKGVLPTAILGSSEFDVTKIDISTLQINGISPAKWSFEDVAAPYNDVPTNCNSCTTAGPDGIQDLTLKFSNEALAATFGVVNDNSCLEITITGKLLPAYGGTDIIGKDIIRILNKIN